MLGEELVKIHVKRVPVPLAASCPHCSSGFRIGSDALPPSAVHTSLPTLNPSTCLCPLSSHPWAFAQALLSVPLLPLLLGPFHDSAGSDISHMDNYISVLSFAMLSAEEGWQ